MSFQMKELLFSIGEELAADDLEALKFLCLDLIPLKKQETIQDALGLFRLLREKGMLEEGKLSFLKELLFRIHRIDLLKAHLGTSHGDVERELEEPGRAQVSAYRYLLYQIAEELTKENLTSIKFLLLSELPKSKLQSPTTALGIFIHMEKHGKMNEGDLGMLKKILKDVQPSLLIPIEEYEEKSRARAGAAGNLSTALGQLSLTTGNYNQQVSSPKAAEEMERISQIMAPYKMNHLPHGFCVIINNSEFQNPQNTRRGADKDAAALDKVFSWLQFKVEHHNNLKGEAISRVLRAYSERDHTDQDCFICCLLSHGQKGEILGTDWEPVPLRALLGLFTSSACRTLATKPKIFFVQACQGGQGQGGLSLRGREGALLEADAVVIPSVPDWADLLVGMATVEDFICFRRPRHGSEYIQALCRALETFCPRGKDLLTILTHVNKEVGQKVFGSNKQMPEVKFTLQCPLIFPVPESGNEREEQEEGC
uniref:Caspase-8 n=2 Tax=Ornithorhynchus anatinus TaxID=9258 RepID=F6QIZ8_ORNAN